MGNTFLRLMRATYLGSFLLGTLVLVFGALLPHPVQARAAPQSSSFILHPSSFQQGHVEVAKFKLPITPISAQYFARVLSEAEQSGAQAVVIELDTPGGLVDSMNEMVKEILASPVPVIVYVAPRGAMAASAGVFVVYAGHVAAMAPNTTIGSSEVILNGGGSEGEETTEETGDEAAMRRKVTNQLVAQIRSLAAERGRNPDFGEKAVRESANLHAQDALEQNVVDIVATNVDDLLDQADGRTVQTSSGEVTLDTENAEVRNVELTLIEEILVVLTNPSVAFILISLGTLGITWEFINPGSIFPGVVGAIMLLVGLMALGTLPINAAGIVFLALAFVLFIADIFMPTHGILTAGGIFSLILGGLLLINTGAAPGLPGVSIYTILGVATGLGAFFFFSMYKVVRARRSRPSTGRESLVGSIVQTRTDLSPDGMVFAEGELWQATSANGSIPSGQHVRVVSAEGLLLKVMPLGEGEGVDTRKLNA
jgi:membrane-bound serine protease (ClpP class)